MRARGNTIARTFTRTHRVFLYIATVFVTVMPRPVFSQQTVALQITDQTGAAIRNALVVAITAQGEKVASITSDATGRAAIPCRADFQFQASALGF